MTFYNESVCCFMTLTDLKFAKVIQAPTMLVRGADWSVVWLAGFGWLPGFSPNLVERRQAPPTYPHSVLLGQNSLALEGRSPARTLTPTFARPARSV